MTGSIVDKVAQAIAGRVLDDGDGLYDWYALVDDVADAYREMARAAIVAYEEAKMQDLISGLLVHKMNTDGSMNYIGQKEFLKSEEKPSK